MKKTVLLAIKAYQKYLSPFLGERCRFYPSCSEYTGRAIEKYGLGKGIVKAGKRILKCSSWAGGGVDLP